MKKIIPMILMSMSLVAMDPNNNEEQETQDISPSFIDFGNNLLQHIEDQMNSHPEHRMNRMNRGIELLSQLKQNALRKGDKWCTEDVRSFLDSLDCEDRCSLDLAMSLSKDQQASYVEKYERINGISHTSI